VTIAEKIQQNQGNAKISAVNGFSKGLPVPFDSDSILQQGDTILLPTVMPQVYKQVFGVNQAGEETFGEFIVVDVRNAQGITRAINFFPSTLLKVLWEAEKDNLGQVSMKPQAPLEMKGTAVDFMKSMIGKADPGESDTQTAIKRMLGRQINIPLVEQVKVQRWRSGVAVNELKNANLYTFNF
jgi:hypothetical protein